MEIAWDEAKAALEADAPPLLLDIREPEEVAICRLPGSQHIPMGELPARAGELAREQKIIVYCHHGVRSLHAARWLRAAGFAGAVSLQGGIDAWSRRIDPLIPRY